MRATLALARRPCDRNTEAAPRVLPCVRKEHPRIVSLVPSWTETLFSFGFETEVVGVTRWCVHPKEITDRIEKVGGTKDPDVARIVALRPDLVVCETEENQRADVEALQAAGVEVWLSRVESIDDSLREILSLGEAVGKEEPAAALVARIRESLREVAEARGPDVPVYVPIWRKPWMTIGRATYAHDVLAAVGARNVFADAPGRYPERSPEDAIAVGATAALLPTEPYPFHEKPQGADECVAAGLPRERVALVDGEALTWYGARGVEGVRTVAAAVRRLSRPA